MKYLPFLFLLSVTLFFQCSDADTPAPTPITSGLQDVTYTLEETFILGYEQLAECECDAPAISFTRLVSESRCPVMVSCIWAGEVTVEIDIEESLRELSLNPNQPELATIETTTHRIELIAVNPYPTVLQDIENIDPSVYSLELRVSLL